MLRETQEVLRRSLNETDSPRRVLNPIEVGKLERAVGESLETFKEERRKAKNNRRQQQGAQIKK